jgi:hypothetical protein
MGVMENLRRKEQRANKARANKARALLARAQLQVASEEVLSRVTQNSPSAPLVAVGKRRRRDGGLRQDGSERPTRNQRRKKNRREAEAQAAATSVVSPDEPDEPDEPSTPDPTLEERGDPRTLEATHNDDAGYDTGVFTDNGEAAETPKVHKGSRWWEAYGIHIDEDLWLDEAGTLYGLDSFAHVYKLQERRDAQRIWDAYIKKFWADKELEEPVDHDDDWDEDAAIAAVDLDKQVPENPSLRDLPNGFCPALLKVWNAWGWIRIDRSPRVSL